MGREGFGPFKQFTYQLYDLRQITHVSDPQSRLQYNIGIIIINVFLRGLNKICKVPHTCQ